MRKIFALVGFVTAVLGGCGGRDNGSDDATKYPSNGALVGSVEGMTWTTFSLGATDSQTNPADTVAGVTDRAGKFTYGLSQAQACITDPTTNKQSCGNNGAYSFSPMTFSICKGLPLPTLRGPITSNYALTALPITAWDFSTDMTTIKNIQRVLLMANSNGGDPLTSGIKLSSSLQDASCEWVDWSTSDIQHDAASVRTAAQKDGNRHDWPSDQAVTDYLERIWICSHAGHWGGRHANSGSAIYPAGSLSGNFDAVLDFDGSIEGVVDFSGVTGGVTSPFSAPVAFNGTIAIAPGGTGTMTYTAPASATSPGVSVGLLFEPYGAIGTWQTADGAISGTTSYKNDIGFMPGMLDDIYSAFPRYRFLKKHVTYKRPGASEPTDFMLTIDIGYDNSVRGDLQDWLPVPLVTSNPPTWLTMGGTLDGNTATLTWKSAQLNDTNITSTEIKLILDRNNVTLSGDIIGRDGRGSVGTFTLQGCRT